MSFKGILDGIRTAIAGNDLYDQDYSDLYSDFGDGKIVYDRDAADYTAKHLALVDRLSMRKITTAVQFSLDILSGRLEEPKVAKTKPNWKYFRDC